MKPDVPEVIVVGSLHLDIVVHANARPRAGETIAGTDWDMRSGGKGGNQAIQAAQQGASTMMISRVGSDSFGETLLQRLGAAGVDTRHVKTDPSLRSGMGIALIDADGVPGGVTVAGVNANIDESDILTATAHFAGARLLLLQQEISQTANVAAASLARQSGVQVILNAAPAFPLAEDLADKVNILIVNEVEAGMLTGTDVAGLESALAAADSLARRFPAVVVTLGGLGVVFQERGAVGTHVPAFQVQLRDTLGAGDAFIGGLAASLVNGTDLRGAVEYATAVGALAVSGELERTTSAESVRHFMDSQSDCGT